MIKDTTGIELTPGNGGKDCLGNGEKAYEICCDECDYLACCIDNRFEFENYFDGLDLNYVNRSYPERCEICKDLNCPRLKNKLLIGE